MITLKKKIQIVTGAITAFIVAGAGLFVPVASAPAVSAMEHQVPEPFDGLYGQDLTENIQEIEAISRKSSINNGSSAQVIAAALAQVGYTERSDEYTLFGEWYGIPNGYWCDMFVSWCANQAGVSWNVFPASSSCTLHVNQFKQQGRFYPSAIRGGSYIPQQGDLIFFYEPEEYPSGNVSSHVGLVLYVENGYVYTIEGNALANRLDSWDARWIGGQEESEEPLNRVTVNHYPLDNRRILGYASPNYQNRDPLALDGFVDLGIYADRADIFNALDTQGIMTATSSHTYSPRHGMTRGDFLTALMKVYGLSGGGQDVSSYDDVSSDTSCYDAVMTARSVGIIGAGTDNLFFPNSYISGSEAQDMISRTLQYVGMANQTFSFSSGDSLRYGDYTIRADLASALYTLSLTAKPTVKYTASFQSNGAEGTLPSAAVSEYNQITLPEPGVLQRDGYAFQGWKSSADQRVYAAGKTVILNQDTTFTAQWVENTDSSQTTSDKDILDTSKVYMFQGGEYFFLVKGNNQTSSIQVEAADPDIADVVLSDATDVRGAKYRITAKQSGSTEIKVTSNGQTATIQVDAAASRGSITLDTVNYIMAPGDRYTIGAFITDVSGNPLNQEQIKDMITRGTLKVSDSRTGSIVDLEMLSTGNFQVTGKNQGTTYIIYEIGDTRASVRIDVENGAEPHGVATRNTSYWTPVI